MIRLTTKNFEKVRQSLEQKERSMLDAMIKAHSELASQASTKLKEGLSQRAGRDQKDPNYSNSPKGALPYGHTMRLRNSIGFKIMLAANKVISEIGSGAKNTPINYAKYLEGHNGDGIRPFLWYVEPIYNSHKLLARFWQHYRASQTKGA